MAAREMEAAAVLGLGERQKTMVEDRKKVSETFCSLVSLLNNTLITPPILNISATLDLKVVCVCSMCV